MSTDHSRRLEFYRQKYRNKKLKAHVAEMQADYKEFRALVELAGQKDDNYLLEDLYYRIQREIKKAELELKNDCPIAFVKPSWAQAQMLNAWHPEFEPDLAPSGYQSILDVSSVRVGKTFGLLSSLILWMVPNDPDWPIFEEYEHPVKGKYRVFPRWDWDEYQRSGRKIYSNDEPPKSSCENWLGCVDENHYLLKITPALQRLFPKKYVLTRPDGQLAWYKSEKFIETVFGSRLIAKLYNSDMTAWSGAELFMIGFDEGPPEDKIDEAVFRSAYMHISFTPRDPSNIGQKSALAKKIARGKKQLVGKLKVFQFSMAETENYVLGQGNEKLGAQKKAQRIAVAESMGEAGKVAVGGGFYESSPQVFSHFDRALNILPVDGDLIVRAAKGELNSRELAKYPWLEKVERSNFIRGFDEGLAHPTSCCWTALLRTGEKIVYRDYEKSNASIDERVLDVIELSGNKRVQVNMGQMLSQGQIDHARAQYEGVQRDDAREKATGVRLPRYREVWVREPIRRTFADSKIFKRDPAHPLDDWTENYRRAGMSLERARNEGPAARCDYVNGLLRPDQTRQHLNPAQGGEDNMGCGLYITRDCVTLIERLENYLWEQFKSGPRTGQYTGKPEALGDDLIDSMCLTGDTLVLTQRGEIPIRLVVAGDMAMTRKGWRKIADGGLTQQSAEILELETSSGKILRGTGNHPVFANGEWIRLDTLCIGDYLEVWPNPKPLFLTESSSADTQTPPSVTCGYTTPRPQTIAEKESNSFTGRFGSSSMARFQKDWRFTISTGIPSITTSPTWSVSQLPSIEQSMADLAVRSKEVTLSLSDHWLPNGTGRKKERSGTGTTVRNPGLEGSKTSPAPASSAEPSFSLSSNPSFAPRPALPSGEGSTRSTTYGRNAPAVTSSGSTATQESFPAERESVAAVRRLRLVQDVFNLEIEGEHEYYANGILVHNCYSIFCRLRWLDPEEWRHSASHSDEGRPG